MGDLWLIPSQACTHEPFETVPRKSFLAGSARERRVQTSVCLSCGVHLHDCGFQFDSLTLIKDIYEAYDQRTTVDNDRRKLTHAAHKPLA